MKCSRCDSLAASEHIEQFKVVLLCDQCAVYTRPVKFKLIAKAKKKPLWEKVPEVVEEPVKPEPSGEEFQFREGPDKEFDYGCAALVNVNKRDGTLQVRCGQTPAYYWIKCQCLCDCAERVCERHRNAKCQCTHFIPPNGHYVLDEIGPWQENAIRILEGD
jgi:hypothetical protein